MKHLIIFILSINIAQAKYNKAVYEPEDNRLNINEISNTMFIEYSKTIFAKIDPDLLKTDDGELYEIMGKPIGKYRHMCKDAKFYNEPMASSCTGFLVSKDILLTAGHCNSQEKKCDGSSWVLGFTSENKFIEKDKLFKCKKILAHETDLAKRRDYTLIKLDREVTGIKPLTLRRKGNVNKKDELALLGHPSGLPLKVASSGYIRSNNKKNAYFTTTLDSFHGNSGSPVINTRTGLVEGILTQGEEDYEIDYVRNCRKVKVCKTTECRGEDVTKISIVPFKLIK